MDLDELRREVRLLIKFREKKIKERMGEVGELRWRRIKR